MSQMMETGQAGRKIKSFMNREVEIPFLKKKTTMKWVFGGILGFIIFLIIVIAASSSGSDDSNNSTSGQNDTNQDSIESESEVSNDDSGSNTNSVDSEAEVNYNIDDFTDTNPGCNC